MRKLGVKKYLSLTLFYLITSLILSSISYSQNKRDSYENNNSRQAASNIIEGEIQEHTIYPSRDKDWLIFTSPKAGQYTVTFSNQSVDLKGVVYVQMGLLPPVELATFNSLKPGKTWDVGMTPSQSDVKYFIGIWASNQDKTGKYEIEISEYNSNSNQTKKPISNVPTNGLIASYPFIGNADDLSGNNINGQAYGITYINTGNDLAAKFSSSSSVEITDNYLFDFSSVSGLTIESQIKLLERSNGYILIKMGPGGGSDDEFYLSVSPEGQVSGGFNKNASVYKSVSSISRLSLNTWYNIILTWERNGNISLYIDGALDNKINSQVTSIQNTDAPLIIGDPKMNAPHSIIGLIDEIKIYNRLLSQSEIQSLYNGVRVQ